MRKSTAKWIGRLAVGGFLGLGALAQWASGALGAAGMVPGGSGRPSPPVARLAAPMGEARTEAPGDARVAKREKGRNAKKGGARPNAAPASVLYGRVSRTMDGDTVKLDSGERVRLLGVDTPETKHPTKGVEYYGPEASAYTKRRVTGKRVRLETDHKFRDRYGRILAYIYLEDEKIEESSDTMFNRELLREGFARAYLKDKYSRKAEFIALEADARRRKVGMWAR